MNIYISTYIWVVNAAAVAEREAAACAGGAVYMDKSVFMYTYIRTPMCRYIYVCIYAYVYIHIYIYMSGCICCS